MGDGSQDVLGERLGHTHGCLCVSWDDDVAFAVEDDIACSEDVGCDGEIGVNGEIAGAICVYFWCERDVARFYARGPEHASGVDHARGGCDLPFVHGGGCFACAYVDSLFC